MEDKGGGEMMRERKRERGEGGRNSEVNGVGTSIDLLGLPYCVEWNKEGTLVVFETNGDAD